MVSGAPAAVASKSIGTARTAATDPFTRSMSWPPPARRKLSSLKTPSLRRVVLAAQPCRVRGRHFSFDGLRHHLDAAELDRSAREGWRCTALRPAGVSGGPE